MATSKGEGGSWLYGLILIVSGAIILVIGILNALGITWISDALIGLGHPELVPLVNTIGYLYMAIGAWSVIGGYGLIKDQEWGWGISLVVLSVVIVAFIADVIGGIMAAAWTDIVLWIKLVALIVSAVGMVYLVINKEKYE